MATELLQQEGDRFGYLLGIERYKKERMDTVEAIHSEPNEYRRMLLVERVEMIDLLMNQNQRRHEVLIEGKPLTYPDAK